jgi:hypothetical protein
MIELYYTGAIREAAEQNNYIKSIGGYVSSSKVPNGGLNNLFGSISQLAISNAKNHLNSFEIVGLGLKNNSSNILKDVTFWVEKDVNAVCNFDLAIVSLATDSNGKFMEILSSRMTLPYYATFYNIDGIDKKINIGNLSENIIMGIWLKRELDITKVDVSLSDDQLYAFYQKNESLPIQENITLKIDWQ